MAFTLEEMIAARDTLLRMRSRGVRAYHDQNGERVEYSSDAEMAAAMAALDSAIAEARNARPAGITFRTSKGL